RLDSIFQLDRFSKNLGTAARMERARTFAARKAHQLDSATPEPAPERIGIEAGQVAQALEAPSRQRYGQFFTAALTGGEVQRIERQPIDEFALAPDRDYPDAAATRGQICDFAVRGDSDRGFHPDATYAACQFGRDRIFRFIKPAEPRKIDPCPSVLTRFHYRRDRFSHVRDRLGCGTLRGR